MLNSVALKYDLKAIGIFSKLKHDLPPHTLIISYSALLLPQFDYDTLIC